MNDTNLFLVKCDGNVHGWRYPADMRGERPDIPPMPALCDDCTDYGWADEMDIEQRAAFPAPLPIFELESQSRLADLGREGKGLL